MEEIVIQRGEQLLIGILIIELGDSALQMANFLLIDHGLQSGGFLLRVKFTYKKPSTKLDSLMAGYAAWDRSAFGSFLQVHLYFCA
jgi:hypothetical protein